VFHNVVFFNCYLFVVGLFPFPNTKIQKRFESTKFFSLFFDFFFSEFHTAGRRRRKKYSHLDITSEWEQDIMKKVVIQSL